jgi:uncharacterized protein YggL (DUF469 family)
MLSATIYAELVWLYKINYLRGIMQANEQEKRSRRLRKKLYINEFQVLGFEVSFKFEDVEENTFDSFFSEIMDFVESRDLILGSAGGTDTFTLYVSSFERYGSATEDDRIAFQKWLADKAFIKDAVVAELTDAYYEE